MRGHNFAAAVMVVCNVPFDACCIRFGLLVADICGRVERVPAEACPLERDPLGTFKPTGAVALPANVLVARVVIITSEASLTKYVLDVVAIGSTIPLKQSRFHRVELLAVNPTGLGVRDVE